MILYEKLIQSPEIFTRLIGMSRADFDSLFDKFEPKYFARRLQRQGKIHTLGTQPSMPGRGRHCKLDLRNRLLLTLFWTTARPTQIVLSEIYSMSQSAITKTLHDILFTLHQIPPFNTYSDQENARRLNSVQAVEREYPEVRSMINKNFDVSGR